MKAETYDHDAPEEQVRKEFLSDLKSILDQNRSLSRYLDSENNNGNAISEQMNRIRALPLEERLDIYKKERVQDQATWYAKKAQFNKRKAKLWFVISIMRL